MKIVGHKSDRMHRGYNTIELEDLHQATAKLYTYRTNTLITPEAVAVGLKTYLLGNSARAGVAQW